MNDAPKDGPAVQQSPPKRKPNRGKKGGRKDKDRLSIRLTEQERAELQEKAAAAGYKPAGYVRATILGSPGPRAVRQLPIDRTLLVKTNAGLGHIGGNLNQLAYQANIGNFPVEQEIRAVLAELLGLMDDNRLALGRQVLS